MIVEERIPKKKGQKKKMRIAMPEQNADVRRRNFEEVPLGIYR